MEARDFTKLYGLISVLALVSITLLFNGCGESEQSVQRIGNYAVALRVSPDPPAVGLNTFKVKVEDKGGQPVTDATVHIHYSMPAMAGMPAMADEAKATHVGNARYEARIDLGAGGKFPWDVKVEVVQGQNILAVTQWQVTPGTKGIKFAAAESSTGEVDYYTCTMHPSVKQKEPGTCPICAMDLVPVYKDSGAPEKDTADKKVRTVNIPLYQQQLIGVQRDTVKRRSVSKTIRTIGHVAYNERKIAAINLKFSGWIEKLHVDYTGKFVKRGQPLFDIYSPELVSTQEEYLQVLQETSRPASLASLDQRLSGSNGERQNNLLKSARQRLLLWGISEKQIREIENAGAPKLTLTFYSPVTGYVLEKNAVEGRKAQQGTDLYTIADLSTVWVHADVYEYELPFTKIGQTAEISLSYDPGINYVGKVDYIYPTLESQTRTAKIRLVFPNPDLKLKPDMYADIEIKVNHAGQLTIPETAVLNTGARQLVFVDRGNGRFEPREIKLGTKVGRYYVVLEGLEQGETIVKSGNFLIDAEAHVQGVLQRMED